MDANTLKEIILQQATIKTNAHLIVRSKFSSIVEMPAIIILSGIRRCGKSTLMQQIRAINNEKDYYLNFDDERLLHFTTDDFQLLHETFIELFGLQKTFYFDEIQNIRYWEFFIRRLHNEGNKVFITGSNANLLSKELGTHLTGRHIQVELFPFSFKEYLSFNNISFKENDFYTTEGKATLKKQFENYLHEGGFPEYLETKSSEYLKSLYDSILYRDILVRNKIQNEIEIRELGYYVAGNISKPISYNRLKSIINVKHVNTVKSYLNFFEDTYLVFLLNKFDYSIKKQISNPKKLYFIDNALAKNISFKFSKDKGRFLENMVFVELRRRGHELFYHKGKKECDFLVREKSKITQAIQVSASLENKQTKEREIAGLHEAMNFHGLQEGLILTENENFDIDSEETTIKVRPIYRWLLQK
jgi:predicted AAA+ superfamily ATPase